MIINTLPNRSFPATQQQQQPPSQPPEQGSPVDTFAPVAAGAVLGAGLGYLGAHVGAGLGMQLGLVLTPVEAPLSVLWSNMVTGGQIGLIAGAATLGILGAGIGYLGCKALMGQE